MSIVDELKKYLSSHTEEEIQANWNKVKEATKDIESPTVEEYLGYLRVIEQTDEEKFKMYMERCTKEELAMMLVQANKTIEMIESHLRNQ